MATLAGKNENGQIWFSLAPVLTAISGGDTTDYVYSVCGEGVSTGGEISRSFSVANWQMEQDDIWFFGRAFAESPKLFGLKIPVDLRRTGDSEAAILYENATYLRAVVSGCDTPQQIKIILYLIDDPTVELWRKFVVLADVHVVESFGLQLEQEIIGGSPNWAADNVSMFEGRWTPSG